MNLNLPGKIPLKIHPLFWLVAFFIGWMSSFNLSFAFMALIVILFSVLFHELGHALTAIVFGQKTRIELAAFGGFTYREGRKLKLWEEFLVVLNGPIAGFLLFLLTYSISNSFSIENPLWAFVVKFTLSANLFWTLINLVPVLPLDGGHLLSIILEAILGFKGVKIAILTGIVIAIAISIFFFVMGFFLVGALFLILTFESFRSLRYYRIFTEKDRDAQLQELMKAADEDFQTGNSGQAVEKLQSVRERTQKGILYTMATEELAEIYRNQERYEEAYELLLPIESSLRGETITLLHFLAYVNDDFQKVTELANSCFQEKPTAETALINALAYASLDEPKPALGWLECALREGVSEPQQVLERKEFEGLQQEPRFKALREKILGKS